MAAGFDAIFEALKPALAGSAKRLAVKTDTGSEYTLVTKRASPFPQHKGQPMFFGSVKVGKSYVSFHLMPLYMNLELTGRISPELKKRMQGKSCFNFRNDPEPAIVDELKQLTDTAAKQWAERKWM